MEEERFYRKMKKCFAELKKTDEKKTSSIRIHSLTKKVIEIEIEKKSIREFHVWNLYLM